MKIKRILIILLIILIMNGLFLQVKADMGAKPSITIKLKNMNTTDYLIDLLVYDETGKNYLSEASYNGRGLTKEKINKLHSINLDGWISEGTRWNAYLLMADCEGNSNFEHTFSYFGTPETYKVVIINNKTGETKVSNVVHRNSFTSVIELDVVSMQSVDVSLKEKTVYTVKSYSLPIVVTIIVETLLGFAFLKIHKKDVVLIIIVNFITNLLYQIFIRHFVFNEMDLLEIPLAEMIVIILEGIIYLKFIKTNKNAKIILYTIIANIASALSELFLLLLMVS